MRKYDIPYVRRGPGNYPPPKALEDMTTEEIKKKHILTCGKANGNIEKCRKCISQCQPGKRVIELMNETNTVPLYGGKTLIQKAQEENRKRREALAKGGKPKRNYVRRDGWWEESLASGDQVAWVVTNLGLTKDQAKRRIYQYKCYHKMTGNVEPQSEVKNVNTSIEAKLKSLTEKQKECKDNMDRYMQLYEEQKKCYEKYTLKINTLFSAMDILGMEDT